MMVRTATANDLPEILALMREAFPDENVDELVRQLVADDKFEPAYSLVAEIDQRVAGHVLFSRAFIESRDEQTAVLCLAPLAVAPGCQNRGIGTALVEAGLVLTRERGEAAILVFGRPGYYRRFGFKPAIPLGIEPPYPIRMSEAWMILELRPSILKSVKGTVRFDGPLGDECWW